MPNVVVMTALLKCNYGNTPTTLIVMPSGCACTKLATATVADNVPFMNILPFGMCSSMMNPTVIAATAAAMGAMTPMPCIPATTSPWSPGSKKTSLSGKKVLTSDSKLKCMWGGQISINMPGQFQSMA